MVIALLGKVFFRVNEDIKKRVCRSSLPRKYENEFQFDVRKVQMEAVQGRMEESIVQ